MVRKPILVAFAVACLGFASQPASAKDVDKGKLSPTKVEGICGEKGGTYFADPSGDNYGCGYKGGGGILCDKDTGCLESDGQLDPGQAPLRPAPWPWAGLLGLFGLLGLAGRMGKDADPAR